MTTDPKPEQLASTLDAHVLRVGDRVVALKDIYEPVSDDAPGGLLCTKGDVLVVREITALHTYVSHPERTDNSFWVFGHEVKAQNKEGQHRE